MEKIKVAIIGLDTSHSVELPRLICSPEVKPEARIDGLTVTACQRFETPFQNKEGLDKRQAQLEEWGIKVTESFDEAVKGCDAIMIEINDPAYHLQYFEPAVTLGKPIFLDKPLAGNLEDGRKILALSKQNKARVFSASSLPFIPALSSAVEKLGGEVLLGHTFGLLGTPPTGDPLIWYGVHSFEMLQRLMGCGAEKVFAVDNGVSVVSTISYPEERRGIIESVRGLGSYGGRVQNRRGVQFFSADGAHIYYHLMVAVRDFFQGAPAPIDIEQTFEGLAMMSAANQSIKTGKWAEVEKSE